MTTNLKLGSRVKFSRIWLERLSRDRYARALARRGAVTRNPQHPLAKYIHVKWDDANSSTSYAPVFIEIDWNALHKSVTEQFPETLEYLSETEQS